jgi:LysM repeat protein
MISRRLPAWPLKAYLVIFPILLMAMLFAFAPANQAESAAASSGYYHTVQYGETLSQIALRYGTTVQAIAQANNIVNPNLIYAGTILYIPVGVTPPSSPSYCRTYHTVTYGDTMIRIGAWYGVSPWAIAQANNIYNMNLIYRGQVLCIPW